ncbi:Metallo-dependent phosphatase-like protein [Penicillium digitatum]|uniref:Uncharacterized protein n=3 Tax=Penicillium digitatum TaxID=36651 RepID=K9FVU9_PEND2|nr:hypothetical protein PDIP_41310 [Penicillium digitatum Pd1]EKV12672.1 hypothetical protein PDIG_42730 [Penicillium digitatum PHI26]EKV15072.1 hypothetical protein PDIP_41310 [Penicillium digitatum Pd1]QQK46486.1 Metallo-dependent phosphatase-like protein [Penicillium digitatum]
MSWKPRKLSKDTKFILIRPREPSAWQKFRDEPCLFLARKLDAWRPANIPQLPENPITVVCISNTYHERPKIPPGDILIHAGDLAAEGSFVDLQDTLDWLKAQPHHTKIVVAGRGDKYLDKMKKGSRRWRHGHRQRANWGDIIYLEHQQIIVKAPSGRQLQVCGSPYSPKTTPAAGFQYLRSDNFWTGIPTNLDILITHTPPYTHLDSCRGCLHLLNQIWRCPPRLHIFGCSREHHGTELLYYDALQSAMERIEAAGGGFFNLLNVVKGFARSFFCRDAKARTVLVNACTNGGLWDPERPPITVVI